MAKKGGSGGNSKVEAANAKKAAVQAQKDAKVKAAADAAEAAEWSKGANSRGDARRQEEERKRQEAEAKKAELKRLEALEEHELSKNVDKKAINRAKSAGKKEPARPWEEALKPVVKKNNKGSGSSGKVTQAMIEAKKEAEAAKSAKEAAERAKGITFDNNYGENRNRMAGIEGEARSLDAALAVMSVDDDLQKHPEKRQKAVR